MNYQTHKRLAIFITALCIAALTFGLLPAGVAQAAYADIGPGMQAGADRLAALQNNDGGWDWPLDDGNPASVSPVNTLGPIAKGLAEAYLYTGDADHLAALQDAGDLLLTKIGNFSPSDGYLAFQLDEIFGVTTYTDYVNAHFYDLLAAGTYERSAQSGIYYDTAAYVNQIRTNRSGDKANMAAWDIGVGLAAAAACGAETTAWIDGVKAEIDELDSTQYYDVVGLAGALYGLAYVGEEFDPTAGSHAAASNLADLAEILASYQINNGGFAWNSAYVIPNDGNESI